MRYRHINRGHIPAGGCPICKPRLSRLEHGIEHPRRHYELEEQALVGDCEIDCQEQCAHPELTRPDGTHQCDP